MAGKILYIILVSLSCGTKKVFV